jgi:hypothetical protein
MSRWLVLAVLSTAASVLGCGSSVRPGLSNAPRLGGTPTVDNRISDVVSNGDDACAAYAENGVLRYRVPPCESWANTRSSYELTLPSVGEPPGALVKPWVVHFYVGWPCPGATSSRQTKSWLPLNTDAATCSVP